MSAVVETNRGGICGICQEGFSTFNRPITHQGGRHDGFHKTCLATWLRQNPTCPYNSRLIDANTIPETRIERIMERLKPALTNAACAAFFGTTASVAGTLVACVVPKTAGLAPAIAAAAAGAGVVMGLEAGAILAACAVVTTATQGLGIAAPAIIGAAVGVRAAIGLNRRKVDLISRGNIGMGTYIGTVAASLIAPQELHPLPKILINALSGGIATGTLCLIIRANPLKLRRDEPLA